MRLALMAWWLVVVSSCNEAKSEKPNSAIKEKPPREVKERFREGDILFQVSTSGQGKAIQIATNSAYSHCGLLFKEEDEWVVYEGVQPVKKTVLAAWIARGDHQHYVVKRHKDASRMLTSRDIETIDRIYCSELVYKVYQRGAGISIGRLQKLQEFNLNAPAVREKLKERYGNKIPLNETVISPGSIFEDPTLRLIFRNHTE
ncbi:MAG: peptidoglycan peptidase [Flavobacteriia bacterium]|nr:peptidoglycan peptidase [Flavobacteriia bacterium]